MIIENIVKMLSLTDHLGKSELIELAKGKYQLNNTTKRVYKQAMRELYMNRAKRQWQKQG
jgi:hypothetical protein